MQLNVGVSKNQIPEIGKDCKVWCHGRMGGMSVSPPLRLRLKYLDSHQIYMNLYTKEKC